MFKFISRNHLTYTIVFCILKLEILFQVLVDLVAASVLNLLQLNNPLHLVILGSHQDLEHLVKVWLLVYGFVLASHLLFVFKSSYKLIAGLEN